MGYNKSYDNYGGETRTNALAVTMTTVYGWMTLALAVTGITAAYTASSEALLSMILGSGLGYIVLAFAEIALVWYLSARIGKLSFGAAATMFGIYSILNGLTLSVIFLVYELGTIYAAFFSTAATFGVMSLVGYTTKKDLSGLGGLFTMLLVGLIIGSLVNMFLNSGALDYLITYLGLFVFIGLTAYDTQKIKGWLAAGAQFEGAGVDVRNIAVMGALSLYLDFINIFLYILRLLDDRR